MIIPKCSPSLSHFVMTQNYLVDTHAELSKPDDRSRAPILKLSELLVGADLM